MTFVVLAGKLSLSDLPQFDGLSDLASESFRGRFVMVDEVSFFLLFLMVSRRKQLKDCLSNGISQRGFNFFRPAPPLTHCRDTTGQYANISCDLAH